MIVQRAWKDILERFKAKRAMIIYASILQVSLYHVKMEYYTVEFDEEYMPLVKIRLEKPDNKVVVNEVFSEVLREKLRCKFVYKEVETIEKNAEDVLIECLW